MEHCKDVYGSLKLFATYSCDLKGLIVDENNRILVPYYPPIEDVVLDSALPLSFFPCTAYKSGEASLLRAFFYNNKWCLSTSAKIDADESSWSEPKSFATLFAEGLAQSCNLDVDEFFQVLHTDTAYYFLLPTTGLNRIGKQTDGGEPILLAGVYYQDELHLAESFPPEIVEREQDVIRITPLPEPTMFETFEAFKAAVEATEVGYLVPGTRTRYLNPLYHELFRLRDNRQDIHTHFIYILKSGTPREKQLMAQMYPQLLGQLEETVENLFSLYEQRYKLKRALTLSSDVHAFLKQCHYEYYSNDYTPLQVDDVRRVLLKQPVRIIVAMNKH